MHNIDENEVLRDALSGLNEEVPPMPENLHAAWMQKVEDTKMDKTRTMKRITRWLSVAAALVFVVGGTLLTRDDLRLDATAPENGAYSFSTAYANNYQYAVDEEAAYEYDTAAGGVMMMSKARTTSTAAAAPATTEKKIIRTAGMTIVTQDYDNALNALTASCEGKGGWIESSSESMNSRTSLRTAYLTLRVPQELLDSYLEGAENLGRITNRSESAEDVTASYQDTQTRLNTQLALMERLQALITESGDLSDLLALESQIADTQYQIDSLQSSLNRTDRQVTYSTVSVTLKEEEVVELTDNTVTLGERLVSALQVGREAFTDFLADMAVFSVAALPFIAIVAAAFIIGKVLIRIRRK